MINHELMKIRAKARDNDRQHDRMVRDKLKSLHRSLLYSYQSAWIRKEGTEEFHRALINPDKIKFDYDEKIVSIDPKWGYQCGDVFEWKHTGTRWLILKQELTELAYFRGNCRRCQALEITDKNDLSTTIIWAAIRGPVETKIETIQKSGIVADLPNLTLSVYVTDNERNRELFNRYKKFKFKGRTWQVTAPDDISTPGILEFSAEENYNCDHEDLLIKVVDPNEGQEQEDNMITGETFIKPLSSHIYSVKENIENAIWDVSLESDNKDIEDVVKYEILENGDLKIMWTAMISGSFVLTYGDLIKTIIVESLF